MGYFTSWKFHYHLGFAYGLLLRSRELGERLIAIDELDRWAYDREWQQNLKGDTPNPVLGGHQTREAMAWGAGARKASGVNAPYPSPPYREGVRWP